MARQKADMTGQRFESLHCGWFVVCEYVNREEVYVKFEKTGHVAKTTRSTLLKSNKPRIKDPFAPVVWGVGHHGVGRHRTHRKDGNDTLAYGRWRAMLRRCYGNEKRHSYDSVRVCDEWLCFQNFADWFEEHYIEGFELDKDVLGNGSIYAPDACCFISRADNSRAKSWAYRQALRERILANR